jgi:hypothetical protein
MGLGQENESTQPQAVKYPYQVLKPSCSWICTCQAHQNILFTTIHPPHFNHVWVGLALDPLDIELSHKRYKIFIETSTLNLHSGARYRVDPQLSLSSFEGWSATSMGDHSNHLLKRVKWWMRAVDVVIICILLVWK